MARKHRRERQEIQRAQSDRTDQASAWKGALRGAALGILFAVAGIGMIFSETSENPSSGNSSTQTIRDLPLLIGYFFFVGGLAYLGYLRGGWGWSIGLPCLVGALVGSLGGAMGFWNLRKQP